MNLKKEELKNLLSMEALKTFGAGLSELTEIQMYKTLCAVVRDILAKNRKQFKDDFIAKEKKQVFYMSMEFLVGKSLKNNLFNMGLTKAFSDILSENGFNLETLFEMEPDAGLGNGGLGRLASCYMDSLTTQNYPAKGFSIRYEFGIFRQKIVDGWQMEFPDDWLSLGDVNLRPRPEDSFEVKFEGDVVEHFENDKFYITHENYTSVMAVPYDLFISGYKTDAVNPLVLWSAKSPSKNSIDLNYFVRGDHLKALEQNTKAEVISKVLYPADDHEEGKILRLKQQYLLVSASLQSILKEHIKNYGDLRLLPDKVAVHINDTHPSLCVPELMRLLVDEHGFSWDEAFDITQRTLSYTNHTVMSEALEKWPEHIFSKLLPRIYQIVKEINRRLNLSLSEIYPGDYAKINYMAPLADGQVKMANLCLSSCHKINGVSKLHTEILKDSIFKDYYNIKPESFLNITNGITMRRWLYQANPGLTKLLKDLLGDKFIKDSTRLSDLLNFKDDKEVLASLRDVKRENKARLSDYISKANGILVDPDSIFDVQIKRLHEYKRQLLNALHIMYLYKVIKENPSIDIPKRTFIFGAKASSGYFMAKQIISLLVALSDTINSDALVRDKLKVVFLEDYKVSVAELIIPAAEISEQISLAGKEASGTGNMKMMLNGAVTLGTEDGANVEILERVGLDNMFLFGMSATEVSDLWRQGYDPLSYIRKSPTLASILNMLIDGTFGKNFPDIYNSFTKNYFGTPDAYMTLADFDSYKNAQERVAETYKDKDLFTKMSLVNIANAGFFSSDRATEEYAKKVWNL